MRRVLSAAVVLATLAVAPAALGWTWPVQGPVLRPYSFTVATEPYPAGQHRGVDVGAAPGTAGSPRHLRGVRRRQDQLSRRSPGPRCSTERLR